MTFDALNMITTPNVWRPVKGHCFETWFKRVMDYSGIKSEYTGGDSMVDITIYVKEKKITLQLKTPTRITTIKNKKISYDLHKTHGNERRPYNLYKHGDFPDFLIGQHPDGFIVCAKENIERHSKYPERLKHTVSFRWTDRLNKYEELGLKKNIRLPDFSWNNKEFPLIGKETKLSDFDILETLMREENFRLLEQNLAGIIREWYFIQIAMSKKIMMRQSVSQKDIKIDFILANGKTIQVKGRTKSISKNSMLCVEVKGSHGRVPQRLYEKKSFDFLVVILDPFTIPKHLLPQDIKRSEYNCVVIPESFLPIHPKSTEWGKKYYKDIFCFEIDEININDLGLLKPCICNLQTISP